MLILSWNVNRRRPGDHIAKIKSVRPDIVTLQEVKRNLADDWADHLKNIGLVHHYRSGNKALALSHQCLIASRWNLTPNDICRPREPPYPESLDRATVSVPGEGDIDLFTAHIPNGSGNGWRKIDTFQVLAAELRRANDSPRILTGDFNEPKRFEESGQIVTFEGGAHEDGRTNTGHWCDQFGVERPLKEWSEGVLSVLDGESQHGLRDAYRDLHGFEKPIPVTYGTRTNPRCFDHTFVSRHFDVLECDYHHEWREQELSDHSPMWARLRLRTDQPDWKKRLALALQKMLVSTLNWFAPMRLCRRFACSLKRAFARLEE
ncbi:MAG: endonuclease/exonuclease/phosphatase family protein [Bryobacterales bacterium]|nr:endonuclease/exonuclease/phosphatase family protein [Bryobacterales bacterium]